MTAPILTVTLNPAVDVNSSVPELLPQQKLRCTPPRYFAGGGGVNVSRALKELGGESQAFVALGGGTGTHYEQLLRDAEISAEVWTIEAETRFSFSVLEDATSRHFRFVLPGPTMTPLEGERVLSRLSQMLAAGFRYVVASGSLPPGLPANTYGRLADMARSHGSKLVLDTQGDALRATLPCRPHVVRLADYEARGLVGGVDADTPQKLAAELMRLSGADLIVITLGARGAVALTGDKTIEIRPPVVDVHSAVGAGDSFVAALTLGLAREWPFEVAVRYGVAAATSAVTTSFNQLCERRSTEQFFTELGGVLHHAA